ncbi:MAG: hypothetical protein R2770_00940 [Acidimicrobiales bacterium]
MGPSVKWLAGLLLAVALASACSGDGAPENSAETAPSQTEQPPQPSPANESLYEGRFFDTDVGIGESSLAFWRLPVADVAELIDESDLVFVGTLIGSSADVAEVRLVTDPTIDDHSTVVYDGLEFRVDRLLSGTTAGDRVTVGHPALIRYEDGLARIAVEPIDLLRPELEAKEARHQWLVFGRFDDHAAGLLTISDGRLVKLGPGGIIAAGARGAFEHRLPGTAFETSVDDIDALINHGVPLPVPQTPDMSREELLEAGVPEGGVRHDENLHGPDSPCYQLDDPERLAELTEQDAC